MTDLSLRHAIGQLLIVGFEGYKLPIPLLGAIGKGEVGGVILFSRNIESRTQLKALVAEIRAIPAPYPLWIAVDQEGGRVQRIGPSLGTEALPKALDVGQMDAQSAYEIGKKTALELKSLGFNLNFAPVLDIHSNPANPIIGDRAYGTDADTVIASALPVMQAHLDAGVVPCGKHFPGHGDTHNDSHLEKTVIDVTLETLRTRELLPFKAAIAANLPMIMTAHINIPALDEMMPATLSREVMTHLLREELGFSGIILSDDLEMAAICDYFSVQKAIVFGLRAGVDAFLICKSQGLWVNLCRQIGELTRNDEDLKNSIFVAAKRILEAKTRYLI